MESAFATDHKTDSAGEGGASEKCGFDSGIRPKKGPGLFGRWAEFGAATARCGLVHRAGGKHLTYCRTLSGIKRVRISLSAESGLGRLTDSHLGSQGVHDPASP
jgi:hypothetical protein